MSESSWRTGEISFPVTGKPPRLCSPWTFSQRTPYPADVVIYVRGGIVQEVRSNDPYLAVTVVDYDETDADRLEDLEEAEKVGEQDGMRVVY